MIDRNTVSGKIYPLWDHSRVTSQTLLALAVERSKLSSTEASRLVNSYRLDLGLVELLLELSLEQELR